MADYISRDEAIKEFCDDCMDREWCKSNGESCSRIKNINSVPAADVRPVVRGRWEDRCTAGIEETVCSECLHGGFHHFSFCPNCGADMREETK